MKCATRVRPKFFSMSHKSITSISRFSKIEKVRCPACNSGLVYPGIQLGKVNCKECNHVFWESEGNEDKIEMARLIRKK